MERYFDYLRPDGLKQRTVTCSLSPTGIEKDITISLQLLDSKNMKMEDRTLYVKQVDEEFRDIGQIQQCINSRRRRFI